MSEEDEDRDYREETFVILGVIALGILLWLGLMAYSFMGGPFR